MTQFFTLSFWKGGLILVWPNLYRTQIQIYFDTTFYFSFPFHALNSSTTLPYLQLKIIKICIESYCFHDFWTPNEFTPIVSLRLYRNNFSANLKIFLGSSSAVALIYTQYLLSSSFRLVLTAHTCIARSYFSHICVSVFIYGLFSLISMPCTRSHNTSHCMAYNEWYCTNFSIYLPFSSSSLLAWHSKSARFFV